MKKAQIGPQRKLVQLMLSEAYSQTVEDPESYFSDVFSDDFPLFTHLVPHLRVVILADIARWLLCDSEPCPASLSDVHEAAVGWLFKTARDALESEVTDCFGLDTKVEKPISQRNPFPLDGAWMRELDANTAVEREAMRDALSGGVPTPAPKPIRSPLIDFSHIPRRDVYKEFSTAFTRAFHPLPSSFRPPQAAVPSSDNRFRRLILDVLAEIDVEGLLGVRLRPSAEGRAKREKGTLGQLNADDKDLFTWLALLGMFTCTLHRCSSSVRVRECEVHEPVSLRRVLQAADAANSAFCATWESDPSCVARAAAELLLLGPSGNFADSPDDEDGSEVRGSDGRVARGSSRDLGDVIPLPQIKRTHYDRGVRVMRLIEEVASLTPGSPPLERPVWECARDVVAMAAVTELHAPLVPSMAHLAREKSYLQQLAKGTTLSPMDRASVAACGAVFAGIPVGVRGTRQSAYTVNHLRQIRMQAQYHAEMERASSNAGLSTEAARMVIRAAYDSPDARLAAIRSAAVQRTATVRLDFFGPRDELRKRDEEDAPRCSQCDAREGAEVKLLTCARCKRTRYCSRECQAADWKSHKTECAAWAAGRSHADSTRSS